MKDNHLCPECGHPDGIHRKTRGARICQFEYVKRTDGLPGEPDIGGEWTATPCVCTTYPGQAGRQMTLDA